MRKKCCMPIYMRHPMMTAGVVFLAGVGMCGIVMSVKNKKAAMGNAVKKYTADCVQKCESICSSMCQTLCEKLEGMGGGSQQNDCTCAPCDCTGESDTSKSADTKKQSN